MDHTVGAWRLDPGWWLVFDERRFPRCKDCGLMAWDRRLQAGVHVYECRYCVG